jgi:hypothetical protein
MAADQYRFGRGLLRAWRGSGRRADRGRTGESVRQGVRARVFAALCLHVFFMPIAQLWMPRGADFVGVGLSTAA